MPLQAVGALPALEGDAAKEPAVRLPLSRKAGYAAGKLVELVVGSMLNVFVPLYPTSICRLPGDLASRAIGARLVLKAMVCPLPRITGGYLPPKCLRTFAKRAAAMLHHLSALSPEGVS